MKKKYLIPTAIFVKLPTSLCQSLAISGEDEDSRKSTKFEGSTGFLWEDDTEEK